MTKQWLMRRVRAQPGFALDHRAHQLVGVQAALHERLGLALARQRDRRLGRRFAVRRVDDRKPARSSRPRRRRALILVSGPTRIGTISPSWPPRPRRAASSRRTGAPRRTALVGAPCTARSGAGTSRACVPCFMPSFLQPSSARPSTLTRVVALFDDISRSFTHLYPVVSRTVATNA